VQGDGRDVFAEIKKYNKKNIRRNTLKNKKIKEILAKYEQS